MQLHDILQLRTSVILPEAISDGGLAPTTDTNLFLTTYRGGSHLPSDITILALQSTTTHLCRVFTFQESTEILQHMYRRKQTKLEKEIEKLKS